MELIHVQKILGAIASATTDQLPLLLDAIVKRYREVFPDWEITIISIDKLSDRNEQIDRMINLLETSKTSP